MRALLAIPLLALLGLGACKKPVLEVPLDFIPPLVLSTPIEDSLPAEAVRALKLEGVSGIKVKHYNGFHASYFEYEADRNLLLRTISNLPFSMGASKSDTQCRPISFEDVEAIQRRLPPGEFENATFFWSADRSDLKIFECVKPPYRHIIQIRGNSTQIRHRIELLG